MRGLNSFEIHIIIEFQMMKGPSKVDNLIIIEVDRYKICAIFFSRHLYRGCSIGLWGLCLV